MTTENTCLVCGSSTGVRLKWRGQRHHPTYYSCTNCGLVFAHPQNDADYEHSLFIPPTDDEYNTRKRNFGLRYNRIREYLPERPLKVLDIGCYNGAFLEYAKERGCEVLGIEPVIDYAGYARRRSGADVIAGIFEDQSFRTRFGLITLFNVLEHTRNPREVLAKAHPLLEDDGVLVLEVPYIFTVQGLLTLRRWYHFEATHHWFFNRRNIQRLLKETGYRVLACSFVPKVVPLSRVFDCLLSRTVYMHVKRSTYLELRKSRFYQFMNRIEIKVNIRDYLLVIAKRQTSESLPQ